MSPGDLIAWCAALAVLAWALRGMPWHRLADRESATVFVVVLLALLAMRAMSVTLLPGMALHLVGAAIATLMFGWRFALLALAAAGLLDSAWTGTAWLGLPWDFLFGAALPVAGVWWLLAAGRKWLPRNPFAYVFGAAFAGGALAMLLAQGSKAALMLALGLSDADTVAEHYLLTLPAMMFSEAFFSGGTLAILAIYRPQWVATFDDDFYLRAAPAGRGD
jgi:uncharacterized membrane protein